MGILSLLTVLLGFAFIVIGLGLGVVDGDTLGGMDGLVLGLATVFVGYVTLKGL